MRRQDHVRARDEQRERVVVDDRVGAVLVEEVRFLLVDVQPGAAHGAAVQRVQQRFAVDQRAARGIQDKDALFHLGEGVAVQDVPRVRRQRAVQRDHVAFPEQRVELDVIEPAVLCGELVVGEHAHAKRLRQPAGSLADAAKSNDSHRLAVQLDKRVVPVAPVLTALPFSLMHGPVVMPDMMADLKQQRDGKLPH